VLPRRGRAGGHRGAQFVQLAVDLGLCGKGRRDLLGEQVEAVDLLGRGADLVVNIVEERVRQLYAVGSR
jgi:hypothetical protein